MRIINTIIAMLIPLIFLGGCAHHQSTRRLNKKHASYHLTQQEADDSRIINDIRVSYKKSSYIKQSDCTIVQMTIENKSDNVCSFNQSDVKIPLLTQKEAERLIRSSGFRRAIRIILPISVGLAAYLTPSALIWESATQGAGMLLLFTLPVGIIAGAVLATGTYFIIKTILPKKVNADFFNCIYENNTHMTVFSNEIQSMLLLVKGPLKEDLKISLQTDHGPLDYALELDNQ